MPHGLSIDEIEALFTGAVRVGPDPYPVALERRYRAVGRTAAGRHAFVGFTWRRQ